MVGKSLISFEIGENREIPKTDWIFFSSKHAVRYFFKLGYSVAGKKLACVGKGTAGELYQFVNHINFIGNAVDIQEVGKNFAEVAQLETVLFPISNISKRSVQQQLKNSSKGADVVVYHTVQETNFPKPEASILIFTSPSNVRAYLGLHSIDFNQTVIAIGPSTGKQLKKLGVNNYKMPFFTGELGLIDLVVGA